MRSRLRAPRSRGAALLATLLLLAGACTAGAPEVASAGEAADAFVKAWNERDFATMDQALDEESGKRWSADLLGSWQARSLGKGDITSIDVARVGDMDVPPDEDILKAESSVPAEVPYSISYSSDAVSETLPLVGTFELVYAPADDAWEVRFERSMLWPGVEGARSFKLASRWPRRGRITDRRGKVLARGSQLERTYPFGSLGGSTIGHLAPLSRGDVAAVFEGHEVGDLVGATGLEAAYEERLAGSPRIRLDVVGRGETVLETIGESSGERGRAVRSTLDMRVQAETSAAFGATIGGVVVLDPARGDILAAVTAYEIDPNGHVGARDVAPFNRALSGLYPPGSAMKVVTASAALDSGVVKPSTRLTGPEEYQGVRNFESAAFASLDFATALKFSVNTAFAQVAQDLGAKRLTRYAERFGFNQEPVMPLQAATSSFPFPEDDFDLMWGSIGQAQDLATPLQMASVAATVANDGIRMEPRSSLGDQSNEVRVMSRKVARTLGGLMETVVEGGTGVNARIAGVRVAGKTGTAEVDVDGKRKNHAWFISFAPVGSPQVAVAVVSEYGGIGGQVAAPLARGVLERVLPLTR